MEVIKIKIEKELLALPPGTNTWREQKIDFNPYTATKEELEKELTEDVYEVRRITKRNGAYINYLVKVQDDGLFQELCIIEETDHRNALNAAIETYKREESHWRQSERCRIKSLPWHKRLFNKF